MAQYKVPQDVEADDKLIGPFSFRQFVYLLIAAGLIALAVGLFQLFPLLVIIPLPFVLFFLALALPIKKDQPMETYLAALVSYYIKPRKRFWIPGQRESTITITAPKIQEESRTRDITSEEATHRLSFLADIVDTQGYAIKEANSSAINEDLVAEAQTANDIFETGHFDRLVDRIAKDENERHQEVIKEMREAIEKNEQMGFGGGFQPAPLQKPIGRSPEVSPVVVQPTMPDSQPNEVVMSEEPEKAENIEPVMAKHSIIELANNEDFSVATIAKEAKRIKERDEGEVFISLH